MERGAKSAKAKVETRPTVTMRSRNGGSSSGLQLKRRLAEALEQHKAISEILQLISASPSDVQPVLDAVAERALNLCDAAQAGIFLVEEDALRFAARFGNMLTPEENDSFPLNRALVVGRAVIDRKTIHHADIVPLLDTEYPDARLPQQKFGFRALLGVPLMREDRAIGAIALWRMEARRFTDKQIALVKTFADQAVIAIQNARLFNETKEALERQTATSEILRAISQSPTDVQPVFDTIADAAMNLCGGTFATVVRYDGEVVHIEALASSWKREEADAIRRRYPMPPSRATVASRAILVRDVVNIPDVQEDVEYLIRDVARSAGYRSAVGIPLLLRGVPIGAIGVGRPQPGVFPEKQIALLKTFADQAVIAIENARLFNETKEALEQQTATSEILRVISQSPRDVQPVFDMIVKSAVRLCEARYGAVFRLDDGLVHLAAHHNFSETLLAQWFHTFYPMAPNRGHVSGRAILAGAAVQVPDILADEEYLGAGMKATGFRSLFGVPLLHGGSAIGSIVIYRIEPGHFADKYIELLKTFADQAVIAIENVRLFTELEARTKQLSRSVGELKALGEVGQAVSSTLDLETVLSTIVTRATQLAGMDAGAIYEYDEEREEFFLHTADRFSDELVEALRASPIRKGEGALGRLAVTREPVQVRDIADAGVYQSRVRKILLGLGHRSLLAVPLLREDRVMGGLTVNRKTPGEFAPEVVALLQTFASQSALAIQNARLFREIKEKSRELETASRHKSEFLANMSHELRTPLNAIIGFSEVLSEKLFGEINAKQEEYIADILQSGRHLLSLINDILDLSKIEAGRMELERTTFHLPNAIENALTLVRERAQRHGITLGRTIDDRLGIIDADERKVKQVLLNLLSNALKFTPEGGRIDVRAAARDDGVEISVTDTGVGIAPEDQEAVFEEFRQVGTASKKVEGTGLGLAISRKFIELHGGRIWVESQVGKGSTFAFTLPPSIDQHDQPANGRL